MATRRRRKNASPILMSHIVLGTDGFGMTHHFDAAREVVHVVDADEGRTHVEPVEGRPVEDWMAFVADKRGWRRKQYGVGLDRLLARSLEG